MVTQNGIKLAVHLISSYFGDNVAKVCECLLRRGTLPLAQIIQYTELEKETVRCSLLVLIQHNCVQAFSIIQEGGFGKASRVITQYMVLFDNIIHHMRFPKFLAMVKYLGKECEDIIEGLLQHGRLSLKQISDRHKDTSNQSAGNCTAQDAVKENFNKLVNARYVERCPAHEPNVAPPDEEETSVKKKVSKADKMAEESKTLEERALSEAAPMESQRFLVETYNEIDVDEENSKEHPTSVPVGEKRKRGDLESDAIDGAEKTKKEVLWRPNFEEFMRRLRHKACIENVRTRLDDGAGIVLSAMLEATRSKETKVKTENSIPLSMDAIYEEVIKSIDGRTMTLELVRVSLVQLGCHPLDETYSIDLKSIIELAQNEEVESIVLKRYGREAYRMFRLLSKAGHLLETDKISDTTFVDKKDTAKTLYMLWKDDYLHMEKVSTFGGKQSNFLLWKVNKSSLWEHVLDEMYHAALNLRLRTAYEQEKEKEVLMIPKDKLVGELAKRRKRLQKVRIVLESSLMKLDDAIMLFHNF
ncbi:uncharacterized protein LOC132271795 [Cornus florida]|uniref:uncharacterized protein LOC132271795 n=1 Tax=Cornus florida TaxID=4283 RepID=UPI002898F2CF|nr:uncharacterized protein LOC132271795 [Cornus florida]